MDSEFNWPGLLGLVSVIVVIAALMAVDGALRLKRRIGGHHGRVRQFVMQQYAQRGVGAAAPTVTALPCHLFDEAAPGMCGCRNPSKRCDSVPADRFAASAYGHPDAR